MYYLDGALAIYVLGAVQGLGLISAAMARLGEGSDWQPATQHLFIVCLALVGMETMLALALGLVGYWLPSAATFSVMVIAATCDFSRTQGASSW
jgi:hypothetical protein